MKLFVATHNGHKTREISRILPDFEIVADDPGNVEESAPDFAGNALIKVRAIAARHKGEWCMADDSGLEVAALGGAPGVRSARYSGDDADTERNNALLLKNLEGVDDRKADFTCAIALVDPQGREYAVSGKCFGRILATPSGGGGFGYDPLFAPDGFDKTFADLSEDEKNSISHRGRALAAARRIVLGGRNRRGGFMPWLRLFRAVNLPTVPGDLFVGAATVLASSCVPFERLATGFSLLAPLWWASAASVFVYMFGVAHNDIVGAATDRRRPIPDGEISRASAFAACAACIGAAIFCGWAGGLVLSKGAAFGPWARTAVLIVLSAVLYNRTKFWWMMGFCRALNVLAGAVAAGSPNMRTFAAAAVWWLYISLVTLYSEGESEDPGKKSFVGTLVGATVYLQMTCLVAFAIAAPSCPAMRPLLLAGAAMLALLRLFKSILPKVEAS